MRVSSYSIVSGLLAVGICFLWGFTSVETFKSGIYFTICAVFGILAILLGFISLYQHKKKNRDENILKVMIGITLGFSPFVLLAILWIIYEMRY